MAKAQLTTLSISHWRDLVNRIHLGLKQQKVTTLKKVHKLYVPCFMGHGRKTLHSSFLHVVHSKQNILAYDHTVMHTHTHIYLCMFGLFFVPSIFRWVCRQPGDSDDGVYWNSSPYCGHHYRGSDLLLCVVGKKEAEEHNWVANCIRL